VITDAELRALLLDCLQLWGVPGKVTAEEAGLRVGDCMVRRGEEPMRWIVETPGRTRPVPSIVALLSAVRRALGAEAGVRLRVGF
jgi:hypothetical protein